MVIICTLYVHASVVSYIYIYIYIGKLGYLPLLNKLICYAMIAIYWYLQGFIAWKCCTNTCNNRLTAIIPPLIAPCKYILFYTWSRLKIERLTCFAHGIIFIFRIARRREPPHGGYFATWWSWPTPEQTVQVLGGYGSPPEISRERNSSW